MMNGTLWVLMTLMASISAECPDPCQEYHILQISEDFWRENFEYNYSYEYRSTRDIYATMTGDCTDFVFFIEEVAGVYQIENVKTVHGWVQYQGRMYRHDWIEYKGLRFEAKKERGHVKRGSGVW